MQVKSKELGQTKILNLTLDLQKIQKAGIGIQIPMEHINSGQIIKQV